MMKCFQALLSISTCIPTQRVDALQSTVGNLLHDRERELSERADAAAVHGAGAGADASVAASAADAAAAAATAAASAAAAGPGPSLPSPASPWAGWSPCQLKVTLEGG